MSKKNSGEMLTIKEAAEYANRTQVTVRLWMTKGWINRHKQPFSGRVKVSRAEIDSLLNEGIKQNAQPA